MDDYRKKFGIIVGVPHYDPTEQIAELPFSKNDAYNLYRTLVTTCGFSDKQLYLLTEGLSDTEGGSPEPPTRAAILAKVNYVARSCTEDDLVLLFFAGHGVEMSQSPYLITADTKMDVLRETAIDVTKLNSMFEQSSPRCLLRIFDSCRTPFSVGRGHQGRMTDNLQKALCHKAKGWATLSSCSSGEIAYEHGEFKAGVFSYFLCEGLKGKARNAQGHVTLDALVDFLRISVSAWCDTQSLRQTPHVQSDLSGALILSSAEPEEKADAVPIDSPLAQLQSGLALHLSSHESDARNLSYTDSERHELFAAKTLSSFRTLVEQFSDSAISAEMSDPFRLQDAPVAMKYFDAEMKSKKVEDLFKGDTAAASIVFRGSEVVVPSSTLCVATARFSFFYWIWYVHRCEVPESRFRPRPQDYQGIFTFSGNDTRDATKVERTVHEILKRASSGMLDWAGQLSEFVDSRLEALR